MKLDSQYWQAEFWRMALVAFIALVGAMLSGHWLLSLCLCLLAYIIWLLYKLQKFNAWLDDGARADRRTDSDGIWLRLESRILDMKRKSKKHKKRTSKILKRFQGIIKGLPYATVVLNELNEIEWANDKARDYLNVDIRTDRGQRIDNIVRSPKAVKLFNADTSAEIEISLPHNDYRRLAMQFVSIKKDLRLVLARDISDRIYVMQMRKNFISNASHELRSPLTVIAGYLEMMLEDESLPDHLRVAVSQSSSQSARMKNIIEDMLTLSRLEKSELDGDLSAEINVAAILDSICSSEFGMIKKLNQSIVTKIDDSLQLIGVESEIISVLNNLIQNAVRHTPEETRITVEWFKNDSGEACLSVSDNGPGIPEDHIPYLTQRFYRVDQGRSREGGGTGLGLAIVQHIIQRHGGTLEIDSILGSGSQFTAIFPEDKVLDLQTAAA